MALAVAKTYSRLLAYKDEYEVARLISAPALRDEIAQNFAPNARISFNLAPPLLAWKGRNGRPMKRAFGPWILPCLTLLARLRGLRGTWADPFGHTRERRMERTLIGEYEALVQRVMRALTNDNVAETARVLGMADAIRGFGPVKEASVDRYRNAVGTAENAFLSLTPRPAYDERAACRFGASIMTGTRRTACAIDAAGSGEDDRLVPVGKNALLGNQAQSAGEDAGFDVLANPN